MKNLFITVAFAAIFAIGSNEMANRKLEEEKRNIMDSLNVQQSQTTFEFGEEKIDIIDLLYSDNFININGKLDLSKIGTQQFDVELYDFASTGEKVSKSETLTFEIKDTIAPEIIAENVHIYTGEKPLYNVTVSDFHCSCSYEIDDSEVNFNKTGEYMANIVAQDECGNISRAEFKVTVEEKPVTIWYINTIQAPYNEIQRLIDAKNTASAIFKDGTKWVFRHAQYGGSEWYSIKVGDLLVVDGVTYTVTNSTTGEQTDCYTLIVNGRDIFAGDTVPSGHKLVMKTCYSGTTNWVVTAD